MLFRERIPGCGSLLANRRLEDRLGLNGTIHRTGLCLFNLFHNVVPGDDLTENGVVHVKPRGFRGGDKKLAAVCSRAGICHRQKSGAVKFDIRVAFIFERPTPERLAAASGPGRIAALDHELRNNPVENNAVVITLSDQSDEIFNGLGSHFGHQFDFNGSLIGFQNGDDFRHDMDVFEMDV